MGNIYLVDFENVGSDGLSGILNLTADDRVIIFYSTRSNRLTMRAHILIGRAEAQFTYYEATVGAKNALDHQLSTYLGYLIGSNAAERYYIVSKDNGYRYASNFWNELLKQTAVFCIDSIKNAPRITERMLRKSQAEMTLRTADDLHDDDLSESEENPGEEPCSEENSAAAGLMAQNADLQEISSQNCQDPGEMFVQQLEESAEELSPVTESIPEGIESSAGNSMSEEGSSLSELLKSDQPDMDKPQICTDRSNLPNTEERKVSPELTEEAVQPEGFQLQEPQHLLSAASDIPALPAPAEESAAAAPEILFPENEIDDVPDPNRNLRSTSRRQQTWQENKGRHNRRTGNNQRNEDFRRNNNDTTAAEHKSNGNTGRKEDVKTAQTQQGNTVSAQNEMQHSRQSSNNEHTTPKNNEKGTPERTADIDKKAAQNKSHEYKQEKPVIQTEKSDSYEWLGPLLSPYPKLSADRIREMIAGRQKQVLCNSLRKQLGQEKGLALYSEIKKMAWK